MNATDSLPTKAKELRGLLLAERAFHAQEIARHAEELGAERKAKDHAQEEMKRLMGIIKELQRNRFGRSSERLDVDQLMLAFEDVEQAIAAAQAAAEKDAKPRTKPDAPRRRKVNLGALPLHFPREVVVIEPEDKNCKCCGIQRPRIGEDRSERLDVTPAQFKVIVTVRPIYASNTDGCEACAGNIKLSQAPAPERLVEKGIPTEALVAHVVVAKYADHLPLYRQAQIYARQGIELDRSTLADWVGRAAFALRPVHARLLENLKQSGKLFADETRVPVLDPGRGETKKGQFWAYARDERPWKGAAPPAVVYVYEPDRKHARPAKHLAGFCGVLQVDGYGAYTDLAAAGKVQLAFCWSHSRRKFYDIQAATPAPIAAEALMRIAALYAIENDIRGRSAEERKQERQKRSKPLVEALKVWLEDKLKTVSAKSTIAEAIRYSLSRWEGLCRFLDDGRIEIDSNVVERGMRAVALGRKNHLFAGSDYGAEHWGVISSLIATCKMNGVDPLAYLRDVLTKIVARHPMSRIDELLPFAYRPTQAENEAA